MNKLFIWLKLTVLIILIFIGFGITTKQADAGYCTSEAPCQTADPVMCLEPSIYECATELGYTCQDMSDIYCTGGLFCPNAQQCNSPPLPPCSGATPCGTFPDCTAQNACGSCGSLPAGYGDSCTSPPNACGDTNLGTIGCSGCSATTPSDPAGYGDPCTLTSSANACGATKTCPGTKDCSGTCIGTCDPPDMPVGYENVCDDGNACTTGETIGCGGCGGGASVNCDDSNVCTTDSCDPFSGCDNVPNTKSCSDGNLCTTGDICSNGSCVGALTECNAMEPCASGSCSPSTGECIYPAVVLPMDCDDGNSCTQNDKCSAVTGCKGSPYSCPIGPCTLAICDGSGGCAFANNGALCPGGTCDGSGNCVPSTTNCGNGSLNAGEACDTGISYSNEACGSGACSGTRSKTCNASCTGFDYGNCSSYTLSCTADSNVCTTDTCDATGACIATNNTASCNDGLSCNGTDTCSNGSCSVHSNPTGCAATCGNGTLNTGETCDTGISYSNEACGSGACSGTRSRTCNATCTGFNYGNCSSYTNSCTADSNVCTTDTCNTLGVCTAVNNTISCNDGNACTNPDVCNAGVCSGPNICSSVNLIAENLSITGTLIAGQTLGFTAVVRNSGSAVAGASQTRLRLDRDRNGYDQFPANQSTGALNVNATESETWANAWVNVPAGNHRMEVCADVALAVAESNESDNCTTYDFVVAPVGGCNPATVGSNQMQGCSYTGMNFGTLTGSTLSGYPTLTSPAPASAAPLPYQNWGTGGPNGLINNYSVRWKGRFNFNAGTYTFSVGSDDGSRVYFDDNLDGTPDTGYLASFWADRPYGTTAGVPVNVSQGQHVVVFEMYENTENAAYSLSWTSAPCANCAVCDNTWRTLGVGGQTASQPVGTMIASGLNSMYQNSVGVVIRGADNKIYHQNCIFSGAGTECLWQNFWNDLSASGHTTTFSPKTSIGSSWDIRIKYNVNQIWPNINNAMGWTDWYQESFGETDWGWPFRFTDKFNRTWQLKRDPLPDRIAYNCGGNACVPAVYKAGSFSPASVVAGGAFTTYCDYNIRGMDAIDATVLGGTCTFDTFTTGTQARFNCTAPLSGGTFAVTCTNNAGTSHNFCAASNSLGNITVTAPPTVSVNLRGATNGTAVGGGTWAESLSGTSPLSTADFRSDVSGTATGNITYTFYCNRSDTGTNITGGWASQTNEATNPKMLLNQCASVYNTAGTYTAKMVVQRQGVSAEDRVVVTVSAPAPAPSLRGTVWTWDTPPRTVVWNGYSNVTGSVMVFAGAQYQLSWPAVANATSCTLDGSPVSTSATSINTYNVAYLATVTTHTLSCTGPGGTGSSTFTVNVPPRPSNLTRSCNVAGDLMTLHWDLPATYTNAMFRAAAGTDNWTNNPIYDDNNAIDTKVISVTPGQTYHVWVTTKYNPNSAYSDALDGNFVCYPPTPTITLSTGTMTFSGVSGGAAPAAQSFTVTNTGGAGSTLKWRATTDSNWCFVNGGTGPVSNGTFFNGANLAFNATSPALSVTMSPPSNTGSPTCKVRILDNGSSPAASNSPQEIIITYNVRPSNVSNVILTYNACPANNISLSWNAAQSGSVNDKTYTVYRHTSNNSAAAAPVHTTALNVTSYTDNPGIGTFYYWVVANSAGFQSPTRIASAPISRTISACPSAPTITLTPASFTFNGVSGGAAPAAQTLTIQNTGGAGSNLLYRVQTNQTWCRVNGVNSTGSITGGPLAQNASVNVSVTMDNPSTTGSFPCVITVSDNGSAPAATNSPQTRTATYIVTPSNPGGPPSLSLAACPSRTINVSWIASAPAGTTYTLYRNTVNNSTVGVTTVATNIAGTSRTDTPPTGSTYYYWVEANGGTPVQNSARVATNPISQNVSACPASPTISLTPASFTFNGVSMGSNPGTQNITIRNSGAGTLNWTWDRVNQAHTTTPVPATWCRLRTGAGVDVPLGTGGSLGAGASLIYQVYVNNPSTVGSFQDCNIRVSAAGATNSPQFADVTYIVKPGDACTGAGCGSCSGGTCSGGASNAVNANPATCPTEGVVLTWVAGTGATSYNIYRAPHGGAPVLLAGNIGNVLTYTDTTGSSGIFYDYWVEATGGGQTSTNKVAANTNAAAGIAKNLCSITTPTVSPPPSTSGVNCGTIRVSFEDGSVGETEFRIYRSSTDDPATTGPAISTVVSTTSLTTGTAYTYNDTSGVAGTVYYYWVTAFGGGTESVKSGGGSSASPISCNADLGVTNKDISQVNGVTPSGYTVDTCGVAGNQSPPGVVYKIGDIIAYQINLCAKNTMGGYSATSITMTDTMSNLGTINGTTPTLGFTTAQLIAAYNMAVTLPLHIQSVSVVSIDYPSSVKLNIVFNPGDALDPGESAIFTMQAKTSLPANFSGTSSRFQNGMSVTYDKNGSLPGVTTSTNYANTPLLMFRKVIAPSKVEIAP